MLVIWSEIQINQCMSPTILCCTEQCNINLEMLVLKRKLVKYIYIYTYINVFLLNNCLVLYYVTWRNSSDSLHTCRLKTNNH